MLHSTLLRLSLGCALALVAMAPPGARAEERRVLIGHVVGVKGDVYAESPDGVRRAVVCGEPLYENDRVVTLANARASILTGDVYAQIASESELRVARTAAGAPDIAVIAGRVRLIDTELPGNDAPHRISTPDAEIIAGGGDTEAVVTRDPDSVRSMLCAWSTPVGVRALRDGSEAIAQPGECATARQHVSIFRAARGASRLAVGEDATCDLANVTGNASDLLSPIDVAGGPGSKRGRAVLSGGRPNSPVPACSVPGSCGGGGGTSPPTTPPARVPVPVIEPPAVIKLPPGAPRLPGRSDS